MRVCVCGSSVCVDVLHTIGTVFIIWFVYALFTATTEVCPWPTSSCFPCLTWWQMLYSYVIRVKVRWNSLLSATEERSLDSSHWVTWTRWGIWGNHIISMSKSDTTSFKHRMVQIALLILVASAMSGHVPLWRDGGRFIPTSQYGLGKASMHGHQSLHVLLLTAVCALAGECLVGRDPEWRKDLQDHFTCQDRQEIQELACRFRTIRYDPISQDCEGKAAKEALFLPRVSKNWKVGRSWLDTRTSLVHVWGNMLGKCTSASLGKFRCSSLAEGQIFRVCAPKTSGFKISYWSLVFFINGDAKACKKLICTLEIYLSNPIQIKFLSDLIWIKSWLHPI